MGPLMSGTHGHEDGFREIQLSGKQLVFLFMAVTVVLVVTFLTGVLVGRGVKAERADAVASDMSEAPETPVRLPSASTEPPAVDPRTAAPPSPAEEEAPADARTRPEPEEPTPAIDRSKSRTPDAAAKAGAAAAAGANAAKPAAAPVTAPAAPATNAAPTSTTTTPAVRNGYAVQVAAVNARGEADTIVKRLTGKGYAAYVEVPKGSVSTFRVRVGTFKTRREAQVVADKLKKEEKFKPWVTR